MNKREEFSRRILEWWRHNKRDFPWRRTRDPYKIVIAEMLLRKTTAEQVAKVYSSLVERYPTPQALADADEETLRELLRPLGMENTRAHLLKSCGEYISKKYGGTVPGDERLLLKIPGVGLYTANAVLSFVYGKDVPLLDRNFIRVIARVFGVFSEKKRPHLDKKLWAFAKSLIPKGLSREFNLAVLDFAALICKSRNPKCSSCPVKDICSAYLSTLS